MSKETVTGRFMVQGLDSFGAFVGSGGPAKRQWMIVLMVIVILVVTAPNTVNPYNFYHNGYSTSLLYPTPQRFPRDEANI